MNDRDFRELVREMRTKQRAWFKGDKSSETLNESKRLERAVDKALKDDDAGPDLFSHVHG